MAGGKLQIQTGAGGCCDSDDPCDLLATTGSYITVAGTWTPTSDSSPGYSITVQKTSSSSAIIKWSHASDFGNCYELCTFCKIQNAGDKALLLFNYDLTADTYDYIEIEAGAAGTGTGGKIRLYVGGVLQTERPASVIPGNMLTVGIATGAFVQHDCVATFTCRNTIDIAGVSFNYGAAFSTATTTFGEAPFSFSSATGGYGFGTGPANTGDVWWFAKFWLKMNVIADCPITGGYDCAAGFSDCGYCADATRPGRITVTMITPDGTPYVPRIDNAFTDQSYDCLVVPSDCRWQYNSPVLNDGAFNYTFGVQVGIVCCAGDYYLGVSLTESHPIFGTFNETYYYELTGWDFDCDLADFTFDDTNFVATPGTPSSGCGGMPYNTGNTGEYVSGNNKILLEFHRI